MSQHTVHLYGISAALIVLLLLVSCARHKSVPETELQGPTTSIQEDEMGRSEPLPQQFQTREDGEVATDVPESPNTGVGATTSALPSSTEAPRVDVVITFDEPVYVNMPVWIHVRYTTTGRDCPIQENIRYPFSTTPWHFGLFEFDVRKGDKPYPMIHIPSGLQMGNDRIGPAGGSCAPPTSPKHRLPLHLQYRFEEPGTYFVKFRAHSPSFPKRAVVAESAWTRLEVKPFSDSQRRAWLRQKKTNPPEDTVLLIGDYLPSILAHPDDEVLGILLSYVHHRDGLVESFALHSLAYYGEEILRREIQRLVKEKGPTDLLAHVLSWRRDLFQKRGEEIAATVIPFLTSRDARQVGGAIRALDFLKAHYSWDDKPDVPKRIDKAVWDAADHILAFTEDEVRRPFCLFMGGVKSNRSRKILWQLSEDESVREQALICLTWIGDARDLPKLGPLLLEDDRDAGFLPYHLRKAYHQEAIPWLKKGLRDSPRSGVRVYCARELAFEDDPEAFMFFREAVAGSDRYYRTNVLSFLYDHFKLERNSTDAEILSFIDSKIRHLSGSRQRY